MRQANVQIIIYPADQIQNPQQQILSFGIKYAKQYSLPVPLKIFHKKNKKPGFDVSQVCYSVSHSGKYWACAFSDCPIGLDIQLHKPCKAELISRRFYHPKEAAWVNSKPLSGFFQVWTAKESYVKYTGEGITDHFSIFSVVNENQITSCNGAFLQHIEFDPEYTLCICTKYPAHATLILK